jgi:tetratricopeptide (TPR) repeat protein
MMKLKSSHIIISALSVFWLNQNPAYSGASESECQVPKVFDLGSHSFDITTDSERVQQLFDQGLNFAYGFNHAEAESMFRAAIELEPDCAICYWGVAYVLGPNINAPMRIDAVPRAHAAVTQARAVMEHASDLEQALILAMDQRYTSEALADRSPLDRAYAQAMRNVMQRFPTSFEAAVLFVDAMMNTMPWNYWTEDKEAKPETAEMIAILQQILKTNPQHPGANHFLIHVVEAVKPELAEDAADRLVNLVPAVGHLQHMPSHIYIRVGRYHDGSLANQRALAADQAYLRGCHTSGFYEMMYIPHNYDFLIATASLEGRQQLAIDTAYQLQDYIEPYVPTMPEMYDLQQFWATPYWALARFGRWDAILAESAPPAGWHYARALWHYARTLAFSRTDQPEQADQEIANLAAVIDRPELQGALIMGLNPAAGILRIGFEEARGELAASRRNFAAAVVHLRKAVDLQDSLIYIEPPAWYHSVRLVLGDVLNQMGRFAEAEQVFRQDLAKFPENAWALYGLYQSLQLQDRLTAASPVYDRFKRAWRYADFNLTSPRL